jgi:hypothetical protein
MKHIVIGMVAVMAMAAPSDFAAAAPRSAMSGDAAERPVDAAAFWTLIDRSAATKDQEAQLTALRALLDTLTPDQIVGFQTQFDAAMARANSWDLWGAAYLANGGASDDGFAYFRSWLISKGERAFETVAARPDALAGLLPADEGDELEFEAIAYAAGDAWAAKTGRNASEMPRSEVVQAEPSGTPFSEDPDALARRYPQLWKRVSNR